MKLSRTQGGGVRLRLDPSERDMLATIIDDLCAALLPDALAPDDPVYQRLYPDGYRDDAKAAAGFRDLTESSLRTERLARAELCRADLAAAVPGKRRLHFDIDAEGGQTWIRVLNDLRLSLGTRLGVSEDTDILDVDPSDPDAPAFAVYAYLTAVQDSLVLALMG